MNLTANILVTKYVPNNKHIPAIHKKSPKIKMLNRFTKTL